MTVSINCKRCKEPILAEDDDDLIAQVEAHAGDHGAHIPSRERILTHLHQRDSEQGSS